MKDQELSPDAQLLIGILLGMTLPVGQGELSGVLDLVAEESGITFSARSKQPHPKREGQIKWGPRFGEVFLSFERIENMLGSLKPSKEQRADFRKSLRDTVMTPLRLRFDEISPELRELSKLLMKPEGADKAAGQSGAAEDALRLPRPLGAAKANGARHPEEIQAAA